MNQLLKFLTENPILLMVLVAWVAGMIGQIGKAAKKARERTQQSPPPPEAEVDAAEIAREMRRILRRAEPEPAAPRPPLPTPAPVGRRQVGEEVAPRAVAPTTATRRLSTHIDPHVGESIGQRVHRQRSTVGEHARGTELGTLGGRVQQPVAQRSSAHRFALDDLKRAFVLSEILGPPLSLRPERQI